MKKLIDGDPYKITPTIEDESVIYVLEKQIKQYGFGKSSK